MKNITNYEKTKLLNRADVVKDKLHALVHVMKEIGIDVGLDGQEALSALEKLTKKIENA